MAGDDDFLESLTESSLYSIGASFCDRSPELVDDLLEQGAAIERAGLGPWADAEGVSVESAFRTLVTGLGGALLHRGRRQRPRRAGARASANVTTAAVASKCDGLRCGNGERRAPGQPCVFPVRRTMPTCRPPSQPR